jgi:hypothetical protein
VSIGKGLEAKSQERDGGSPGGTCGSNKRRTSSSRASKRNPAGRPESTSKKNLLAELPNVKKSPTLSEWTELLESEIGGACPHLLKEQADGSHTSGVTSCSNLRQNADGDTGTESSTGSPPPRSGPAVSRDLKGKAVGAPSGSMPLFQLGVSPSSDSEDSEGTQGALATMGQPIASQFKKDLLSIKAQLPPASKNADLCSPLVSTSMHLPRAPFNTMSGRGGCLCTKYQIFVQSGIVLDKRSWFLSCG